MKKSSIVKKANVQRKCLQTRCGLSIKTATRAGNSMRPWGAGAKQQTTPK